MVFEFDDCVLDTATQELWRDGELVPVEPQVLAVIEHLVANSDRVVTKIELLDEVWGDRFVSESALTSRIKLARRACGDTGREQRVIKTVHSRGYRMVADVTQRGAAPDGPGTAAPPEPVLDSAGPVEATRRGTSRGASTSVFGREDELQVLDDAVAAVVNGERQTVFVCGGIGSGKSTLVAEFLERHDDLEGWSVARGHCLQTRGGVEPYFCLLDALSHLARENEVLVRSTLDHSAPSWLLQLPSLLDDAASERLERRLLGSTGSRMLREGADAFAELAAEHPLALVLEDLHLADDCTLDVLDLLMRRSGSGRLLVVATARPDTPALASVVTAATAAGHGIEIHLPPLGREAIVDLIRDRTGADDVPDELVDLVVERCEGIPLFAEEIVTAWRRDGQIEIVEGKVVFAGDVAQLEATVPSTLPPLIDREISVLDPSELGVLQVCAVAGDGFDAAAIAAATGASVSETEALLSEIDRRHGFISARGAGVWPDGTISASYGFGHRIFREVIHDGMPPSARAVAHARIGQILEEAWGDRADELAIVLADHFLQAGNTLRAVDYLRLAGERSYARSAHRHAVEFMVEGLTRLGELPASTERDRAECQLRASLGPALVATKGWFDDEVSDNYERVLALCGDLAGSPEAAAARYGLATVSELHGTFERTEDLLTPLLVPRGEGPLTLEAHELVACSTFHQGAFTRSLENAEMVLESWDDEAYSVPMARIAEHPASSCSSWSSLALWALGRSDESLAQAERAVLLGERNLYALSTAVQQRAMLHQLRAEIDECIEWSEKCRQVGEDQDFPMRVVQADIYKGWALGVSGSAAEGRALITDGVERFRAADATLNEAYYLGLHADVALHSGDPDAANALIEEALASPTSRSYFYEPELHRIGAGAALRLGHVDSARDALDRSRSAARRLESPALELRTVIDRVDFERDHGDPEGALGDLITLLALYEGQAPTPDTIRANDLLES